MGEFCTHALSAQLQTESEDRERPWATGWEMQHGTLPCRNTT